MQYILELLSTHWMKILGGLILVVVLFGGSLAPQLKVWWAKLMTRVQSVPAPAPATVSIPAQVAEDEDVLDMLAIKRLRARKAYKSNTDVKEALDTLMTNFFGA